MLSRRHLRVKVMQGLYSFFKNDDFEVAKGERELFKSIDKVYELYVSQIALLLEIRGVAQKLIDDNKTKMLPTKEDLSPNTRFIDNALFVKLEENQHLKYLVESRKIHWENEGELVRRIFAGIRSSEEFEKYMALSSSTFEEDQNFLVNLYCNFVGEDPLLLHHYDEQSIHWIDDYYFVNTMVIKTLKQFTSSTDVGFKMLPLWKDEEDDSNFVKDLYRKTIVNAKKYEKLIEEKLQNWEMDRVAFMDMLLMQMAICELFNFNSIPVKVTLNEYIELSKEYSTEKSKVFINGILDKLVVDFRRQNLIVKTGRGLME